MRILIITYDVIDTVFNGATVFCHNLANTLSIRDHDVCVFSGNPTDRYIHLIKERRYKLLRNPYSASRLKRFNSTYDDPAQISFFVKLLTHFSPDIVHFNHLEFMSPKMLKETRKMGIPTIYTAHDFYLICQQVNLLTNRLKVCEGPGDGSKCAWCYQCTLHDRRVYLGNELFNFLLRFIASRCLGTYRHSFKNRNSLFHNYFKYLSSLVSPSQYLMNRLNSFGFQSNCDRVIPNGLPDPVPINVKPRDNKELNFLFLGGTLKKKGAGLLISALHKMTRNASLYIYGATSALHHLLLRGKIRGKKIKIIFKGPYHFSKVDRIMNGMDVHILPSIWEENYPLVVVDALLRGIPSIVPHKGGAKEAGEIGRDIFTFRFRCATSLASTMDMVIEQWNSISKYHEYSRSNKEHWHLSHMVDKYEELYRYLIANNE